MKVIEIENISKQYRLGKIESFTIKDDLKVAWANLLGRKNPVLELGDENTRDVKSSSQYVWALKDISFSVNQGEVLGIIGKNGAGKSTLLKILSRVTAPTTGTIKVKGRIASLLEVGTGFHPDLTGRENIYLNGAILGMSRREVQNKFDEMVAFSGVEKYIDTPVKRYSSGMYVRLAFAVAAHLESEILVVDEVLAVGDAEFQKKCLGKMHDVSLDGRTILFVSHNMATLSNLCSTGLILKNGRILQNTISINQAINLYSQEYFSLAQKSLSERKDRKGNGEIVLTELGVFDDKGNPCNLVFSGQNIRIRIFYQNNLKKAVENVSIAFSIMKRTGEVITVFCNDYTGNKLDVKEEKGYFECAINNFPLMEDIYAMNIMLNKQDIVFDWVENAFSLEVENGDFFGSGRLIESTHKGVLIQQSWKIE